MPYPGPGEPAPQSIGPLAKIPVPGAYTQTDSAVTSEISPDAETLLRVGGPLNDTADSRAVRSLILEMRDQGHCILLSSHIMTEVAMLCDQLVIVSEGAVLAQGTPDELRQRFTADDLEDVFVALTHRD